MTRGSWKALAVVALLTSACGAPPAASKTVSASTVIGPRNAQGMPESVDGYPLASSGTGFYVSRLGHFLTAFHVAGHCQRTLVLHRDGAFPAEPLEFDPGVDVAVFKTLPSPLSAELALPTVPREGENYLIVRYPHLGGLGTRTTVIATGVGSSSLEPGQFLVHASEGLVGGNSGSPIVRLDGGVSGFAQAVVSDRRNYVIAMSVQAAEPALKRAGVPILVHQGELSAARAGIIAINYTFPILCYFREEAAGP